MRARIRMRSPNPWRKNEEGDLRHGTLSDPHHLLFLLFDSEVSDRKSQYPKFSILKPMTNRLPKDANPIVPPGNIEFRRIREIAEGVAKYAGRYTGCETFLGHNLQQVSPILPEHTDSIPPDGKVKIIFEHWSVVADRVDYLSLIHI